MIPTWVSKYVGIPFVSGGRGISGCDCYGLVRIVLMEQFGYNLPLLSGNYKDALVMAETEPVLRSQLPLLTGEKIDKAEPGAVAVIRYQGRSTHIGIYVDGTYILHTLKDIGAHVVSAEGGFLRGGIEGVYRADTRYRASASV
jgi:cell wall-associated NlpC family hydrolase